MRRRIGANLTANQLRLQAARQAYAEIAARFEEAGIEHVALKGLTQWPDFVADPRLRVQYDIDLFCPRPSLLPARDALLALGYQPLREFEDFPLDHLPAMVRKTGYQWSGDFFDPRIPFAVDLHFRFWDEGTEGFPAPGVEEFWPRRQGCVLHPADRLGYVALHLLRHLLRGSLRPYHVYELAWFLENRAEDCEFWSAWSELHTPDLRKLEAVCFRAAAEWFACRLSPLAQEEVDRLPEEVRRWFNQYALAPLAPSNKSELWLHLSLTRTGFGKVLLRRLLPTRLPGPVDAVYVPGSQLTWLLRLRKHSRYAVHLLARAAHHARLLVPTLVQGLAWWMGRDYWIFLLATLLFNFGVGVFVLLYNLHLMDLGFAEDFLGWVASAMTAGSVAGALASAGIMRALGLRRGMMACFAATGTIFLARAAATGPAWLLATAFLGGCVLAAWQASVPPAIAALTSQARRPRGYSLFVSFGIATGILGGLAAGYLAAWFSKLAVLLAGCALAGLAALPLSRLPLSAGVAAQPRAWPRSRFLFRYLAAMAVWSFAVGAFNPFFNAYFARLGASVERIGATFSAAQAAQVAAVLLAPALLRRLGTAGGIAAMQLATAVSLALLAAAPLQAAGVLYSAYTAFQYMSEPGFFTLLMDRVSEGERSGASSLNFFVVFGVQALAAAVAGVAVTRFGYAPVLGGAATLAALAALLFRMMMEPHLPNSTAKNIRT